MQNWLMKRAYLTPDCPAIETADETLSFAQLQERSAKRARQLAMIGVGPGDYVGVLLQNGVHTVTVIHALQFLGAVLVPLNTRLSTRELMWQLDDAEASWLIYDAANQAKGRIMKDNHAVSCYTYEQVLQCSEKHIELKQTVSLDELHSIIYTSGTTGEPKGVLLSYANHWWSAIGSSLNIGLQSDDCWLCAVPMFHVSGLSIVMRSVIYGMSMMIHEPFSAAAANRAILSQKVTMMSVVSTMLKAMMEDLGSQQMYPDHFRCMLLGGGPASQSLLEKAKTQGIPVFQSYGLTETASQIVTLSPEDSLHKLGSAGKPLFPAQLKIINDGYEADTGEDGEIYLQGPNVTQGYLHKKEKTAASFTEDWFKTGDIGYLDQDGFLYVRDRRKDLLITGGENVYPAEIESVLLAYDTVTDAGVTGMSDDTWGQVPVAFVTSDEPTALDTESLIMACREQLAHYKVPKSVYVVSELPRNASGKLLRRNLWHMLRSEKNQ